MKQTRDELYIAADAVSRENPDAWMRFVAEFRFYADNVVMAMLEATPQDLPCAQGRSQEVCNVREILEFCRQQAEKIKRRDTIASPSPLLGKNSAGAKQRES